MSGRTSQLQQRVILLVEDNPGDALLIGEAMADDGQRNTLRHVRDGVAALDYLRTDDAGAPRRPDLIVLDLNLPRKDGREVLREIKSDDRLKSIPVVVLTSSSAPEDIERCYQLNANCYVTKPLDLHGFISVVRLIERFWIEVACLPGPPDACPSA